MLSHPVPSYPAAMQKHAITMHSALFSLFLKSRPYTICLLDRSQIVLCMVAAPKHEFLMNAVIDDDSKIQPKPLGK